MVLKITDETLDEAKRAERLGATKSFMTKLYRKEWLSMKEISVKLSEDFDKAITVKVINSLLHMHDIEKWTPEETKKVNATKPSNPANTKKRVEELSKCGFDKKKFLQMHINQNMSKNEIIASVNNITNKKLLNKNWLIRVFEYYGIDSKSSELIYKRRNEISEKVFLEKYGVKNPMNDKLIAERAIRVREEKRKNK